MANLNLKAIITAEDRASNKLKKIARVGLIGLATAAATAATTVFVFGVKSVKAFAGAEEQMARVRAILKTMPGNWKKNEKVIVDYADRMQRKLAFSNEAVAESTARLFQKTNDLRKAIQLNNIAMDIARMRGMGLEEASLLVLRAMAGNVRILKEFGIKLKESATQEQILAAIHKKTAGQAKAYAATWNGAMEMLRNTWSDVLEKIGETIVKNAHLKKGIEALVNYLTSKNFQKSFNSFLTLLGKFLSTITNLKGMINSIRFAISDLIVTLSVPPPRKKSFWEALKESYLSWRKIFKQSGGFIPTTGFYILHAGERIIPAGQVAKGGSNITINFYGDIHNTTNTNLDNIARRLARQLELARQGVY